MKIYRITEKQVKEAYKTPKGATRYRHRTEEVSKEIDAFDFVFERLDRGGIEDNIRNLQKVVAALVCQDPEKMIEALDCKYSTAEYNSETHISDSVRYEIQP